MREATLRDFFLGKAPAQVLAAEASTAIEQVSRDTRHVHIQDLDAEEQFVVTGPMLVRLCDAVLSGELSPGALEPVGFAVIASDHLGWAETDDLVGRILYAWASPEANWELNEVSVGMFRRWLTGEETPPPEPEFDPGASPARFISRTAKVWLPPSEDAQGGG